MVKIISFKYNFSSRHLDFLKIKVMLPGTNLSILYNSLLLVFQRLILKSGVPGSLYEPIRAYTGLYGSV